MSLEAPTLPCSSCGSALPVDPGRESARCTHCGAVTMVPAPMREQARAYYAAIAGERRKASFAERFARGMAEGDALSKAGSRLFGAIMFLALILTAGQMAPSFTRLGGVVRIWSGVAFAAGLALCLLWFFWQVARYGDEVAKEAERSSSSPPPPATTTGVPPTLVAGTAVESEGAVQSTCSSCGGPCTFQVGQASARCPFCGATVIATAADQARMVAIAGERADLVAARAQRAFYRQHAGFQRNMATGGTILRTVLGVGMPSVILVIVGVSLLSSAPAPVRARGRRGPAEPPVMTYVGLGLIGSGAGLAILATAVGLVASRLSRPRKIGRALAALSAHTRGRLAPEGALPVLDWLDAHWAGPAPDEVLSLPNGHDGRPGRRWSLELSHEGRPALVVVTHDPVRRVDLFVSAYRRRGEEAEAAGRSPAGEDARRAGFALELGQAGVHLVHGDSDPAALEPARVDRLLAAAAGVVKG